MNPHQILIEDVFEFLSSAAMPSKEDEIAFLGVLHDITDFTSTKAARLVSGHHRSNTHRM